MKASSIALRARFRAALLLFSGWVVSSFLLVAPGTVGAQGITLTITGSSGAPGGTANVTLSLSGDDQSQAVGVSDYVTFDEVLSVASSDCQLDPRIVEGTHIKSVLPVCIPAPPAGKKCMNFDIAVNPALGDTNQPLGNGPLMECVFHIGDAPLGPLTLTGSPPPGLEVGDKDGKTLSATVVSGEITVAGATVTPTGTATATVTPTVPATATPTTQPTSTPTRTQTATATRTGTPTNTPLPTSTPTLTPTPQACVIDSDCPQAQICLSQVCSTVECSDTNPCPGGRQCTNGTCAQLPPPTATRTRTPLPTQTPIPTATSAPQGGGGGDGGGCSTVPPGSSDGSVLWLIVPAALAAWRRRRGA